jgi:hypothetical protein
MPVPAFAQLQRKVVCLLRHLQTELVRGLRPVFVAATREAENGEVVQREVHGSAMPKSRQIFRARNLLISCGAERRSEDFAPGFPTMNDCLPRG